MQGVEINTIYVFNVDFAQARLAYRSDLPGQNIFNVIYIYIYMYIYIYIETVFKTKNGLENLHSKRMPKGQVGRRKGAKDSAACMGCNVGKGVFRIAPAPD